MNGEDGDRNTLSINSGTLATSAKLAERQFEYMPDETVNNPDDWVNMEAKNRLLWKNSMAHSSNTQSIALCGLWAKKIKFDMLCPNTV